MLPSPQHVPSASRLPRTFRALGHRNFRLYWSGQIVSLVGVWMQIVAQGWLVYRLTDSELMLSLVSFVGLVPVVPVSLLGGVVSDRLPRRMLILVSEMVLMAQALVLAVLTLLGVVQVWHIIVLSFILAAAAAVEQPARLAFVVDVVGKEDLTNAVALNSGVYNIARIVGPAIAGILVAWIGEAGCFFVKGVTFLPVILALLAIRLPVVDRLRDRQNVGGSLVDGLRYTWETKTIRSLMIIVALSSFLTLPYVVLMPAFAEDVLHVGSDGYGFLMTCVGVGAILGAVAVANVHSGRRGKWLIVSNIVAPGLLVMFCLSSAFTLSLVLALLVGGANAMRQTLANSLIQIRTAEEYHGRVMSVFNLLFNGMSRVGAVGVGAVAEVTGVPLAVGTSAGAMLLAGAAMSWGMPKVRELA